MKRIIFIDIDGTLRGKTKKISNTTKGVLSKLSKMGILIVLCTGRSIGYTRKIAKECGASPYIICSSGAEVYDLSSQSYIYQNTISSDVLFQLWQYCSSNHLRILFNDSDAFAKTIEYNGNVDDFYSFIQQHSISQCTILGKDIQKIKDAQAFVKGIKNIQTQNCSKELFNDSIKCEKYLFVDVTNNSVSKGIGIQKLCSHLNISLKDTISIGDDFNDIAMFQVTDQSVAMGNALDFVKKQAAFVTNSVEEDGLAKILMKLYNLN